MMENKEIMEFRKYLIEENFANSTINSDICSISLFFLWLKSQNLCDSISITKNNVLEYVSYLQSESLKVDTINLRLTTIRKYFNYLIKLNLITKNPAKGVYIRGSVDSVVQNVLTQRKLQELYNEYESYLELKPISKNVKLEVQLHVRRRNLLILSLMIHQGLHTGELARICKADVFLKNGEIYISAGLRSNPRVLGLDSKQIYPLMEYLNEVPEDQELLFNVNMNRCWNEMSRELRGLSPSFKNGIHLRACVIMDWIKKYGKRKAQKMIGHRFVSTTESYELQDTTELAELLKEKHLFG